MKFNALKGFDIVYNPIIYYYFFSIISASIISPDDFVFVDLLLLLPYTLREEGDDEPTTIFLPFIFTLNELISPLLSSIVAMQLPLGPATGNLAITFDVLLPLIDMVLEL
jgi:hypothetical protein